MKALIVVVALHSPLALAEEYPAYCEEPKFVIKTVNTKAKVENLSLISPEESMDPEIGRKLASQPGPYGHSELGFRYLSRLFGYPGTFGDRQKVEDWLAEEEIQNYQQKKGLKKAWDQWVTNPVKRLSVPLGPVNKIPAQAGPGLFFRDRWDQANHARCISRQIALQFCENYLGDRKPEEGDRVYYAGNFPSQCKLVRNPYGYEALRKKDLDKPTPARSNASGAAATTAR
jgi:hypothetical protein